MAVSVLRERSRVEPDWSRAVRLLHQSAPGSILHAGPEHDADPCARSIVRGLWNARDRADSVLHAGPFGSIQVERATAQDILLEPQHRAGDDGLPVAVPTGSLSNLLQL